MLKMTRLLILPVLSALFIIGCSQDEPTTPTGPDDLRLAAAVVMAGAEVQSATLYVYVNQASGNDVSAHRITETWDEGIVTWANFGGAFDPAVEGSFVADGVGWRTADVTSLVAGWTAGSYDNFGLLLQHADLAYPRTILNSRENVANQPLLEICYTTSQGPDCIQVGAVADSYIYELYPTGNHGTQIDLNIGWRTDTDLEKQTLIRFDLPMLPEPAALGDFVWYDTNEDGLQDVGEVGIPDVTVHLYNCTGGLVHTTTTDADGYYLFDNLMPGDYYVEFEAPLGFVFSPQDQGSDDAIDSDADPTSGQTACTTLESGETDLTWDAGLYMPPPQEGCTLTIGYWRNHAGFGPQPDYLSQFLSIYLGDQGGASTLAVTTVQIAYDVLVRKTYGHSSNGITKLYAQLLAAKLNLANGADGSDIDETIADADAFLADHDWTDWNSLTKRQKKTVLRWKSAIDKYNNGIIGPGHCDVVGDGDDD